MSTPETVKAQLQADIAAANKATGKQDATMHDAVASLIEGFGQGQEILYGKGGKMYMEHMTIKTTSGANMWDTYNMYAQCSELKSVVSEGDAVDGYARMFSGCKKLEKAILASFSSLSSETFLSCTSLKEAQVGSIGIPVTSITGFGNTHADLVITIYVADDAALPLANSPFGNANATIIYKSATTGEVIEV